MSSMSSVKNLSRICASPAFCHGCLFDSVFLLHSLHLDVNGMLSLEPSTVEV